MLRWHLAGGVSGITNPWAVGAPGGPSRDRGGNRGLAGHPSCSKPCTESARGCSLPGVHAVFKELLLYTQSYQTPGVSQNTG